MSQLCHAIALSAPDQAPTRSKPPPRSRTARRVSRRLHGSALLANGFSVELLVDLVREGLASVELERMISGGKQIEVARVRITEAGWRALRHGKHAT
jgi:hypothetical protein